MSTIDQSFPAEFASPGSRVRITAGNYQEHLHWDVNCSATEWADGQEHARCHVLHEFNDRGELLELFDALDRGSLEFMSCLQRSSLLAKDIDADVPIEGFISYMFGGAGGGLRGTYARGYFHAFAQLQPYMRSLY